jgi:DNA-binding IclR family transcriptional regulator
MNVTDSSDQDRVLWTLTEHGGSMGKSDLARRLQIRLNELDAVLQELERAGKVKLTESRGKLVVGLRDSR